MNRIKTIYRAPRIKMDIYRASQANAHLLLLILFTQILHDSTNFIKGLI